MDFMMEKYLFFLRLHVVKCELLILLCCWGAGSGLVIRRQTQEDGEMGGKI